jgi:hypothetical protein
VRVMTSQQIHFEPAAFADGMLQQPAQRLNGIICQLTDVRNLNLVTVCLHHVEALFSSRQYGLSMCWNRRTRAHIPTKISSCIG